MRIGWIATDAGRRRRSRNTYTIGIPQCDVISLGTTRTCVRASPPSAGAVCAGRPRAAGDPRRHLLAARLRAVRGALGEADLRLRRLLDRVEVLLLVAD